MHAPQKPHIALRSSGPGILDVPRLGRIVESVAGCEDNGKNSCDMINSHEGNATPCSQGGPFILDLEQRTFRALIHTCQATLALVIMLIAMTFNGYLLCCILLGTFIGYIAFAGDIVYQEEAEALSVCNTRERVGQVEIDQDFLGSMAREPDGSPASEDANAEGSVGWSDRHIGHRVS